uniref:C-type lectin domain-containing protein n=1 Tax=Mola mola TaxID=94237 RepID=A0A3Q3WQ88_MOLML
MKTVVVLSILLCATLRLMLAVKKSVFFNQHNITVLLAARYNICPDGWFSYGSRCFMFVNSPMTWYSAEEHCNSVGANLASVSNPREYSFLQQMAQTGGQSIAWLGGFNLQGRWMWIDREGFYYTNWYSPSSSSSYACMFLRTTNGWGNSPCSSAYRFICSKNTFSC